MYEGAIAVQNYAIIHFDICFYHVEVYDEDNGLLDTYITGKWKKC